MLLHCQRSFVETAVSRLPLLRGKLPGPGSVHQPVSGQGGLLHWYVMGVVYVPLTPMYNTECVSTLFAPACSGADVIDD
jgi:hypothetical protein